MGDPFVHATLSDQDTYTLLNSTGMSGLIGSTRSRPVHPLDRTVTYVVPPSSILSFSDPDSIVSVPASGGAAGFVVVVPTRISGLYSGLVAVLIPVSLVPTNAPPPTNVNLLTGASPTSLPQPDR